MNLKQITRFLLWESMIILGLLVIIGVGLLVSAGLGTATSQPADLVVAFTPAATATMAPSATPTPRLESPPPGGLAPAAGGDSPVVGWSQAAAAGFGPSYLYMLLRDGTVYHGPIQFDLSFIPEGSTVIMTELAERGSERDSSFALKIMAGPGNSDETALPATTQVVFKAGQQVQVQQRLDASPMQVLNLSALFPEGWFNLGQNPQIPPQTAALLPANPPPDGTPRPTATFVVITSTPSPENILTVAAMAPTATYRATTTGTPTPLPPNWVTPFAVTATPQPANQATAQFQQAEAAAFAKLFGTPTPLPPNAVTATPRPQPALPPTETPTPVFVVLQGELPPLTATPVAAYEPVPPLPAELIGKIAFKSDRTGREEIYVINPDGTGLALLTHPWPYNMARLADGFSADGRFRVFTKDAERYKNVDDPYSDDVIGKRADAPALYWYDALYQVEEQLTRFGAGIAYDGVWSPTGEQIAFVSTDSGNDEIWVVNRDGSALAQLTRDAYNWWDKHPSWSADGRQLVFWSNRTGHGQIWVMNPDGANLYSLSRTGYNDYDPVWIKYPGVPGNALPRHIPYTGRFDPFGADRNCGDFMNAGDAQAFYLAAGGPYRDPHRLDRDNNGQACD